MSNPYPSELTQNQLAEAEVLIGIGFAYIGKLEDYFDQEELDKYHCLSWKSWKFNSSPGNCFLDAVCHGEYYSWYLEDHPNLFKPNFLNEAAGAATAVAVRVSEIKSALKAVVYPESNQVGEPSPYQQLSLF